MYKICVWVDAVGEMTLSTSLIYLFTIQPENRKENNFIITKRVKPFLIPVKQFFGYLCTDNIE